MSWQATEAVMLTSRATGSARLALLVLATYADEQGEAWPSAETVANRAALSERQTRTILASLVDAGELVIVRPGGGRQTTTKYRLPQLDWLERVQPGADTLRSTAPFKAPKRGQFSPEHQPERVQSSVKRVQSGADTLRSTAPDPLEPSREPSIKTNTPLTPQGETARDTAAPEAGAGESWLDEAEQGMADQLASLAGEAPDGAPADAGHTPEIVASEAMPQASPAAKRPKAGPKVPRAPATEPTGFQLMFGALALACYGGTEHLTSEASARVGKAVKSLLAKSYAPDDVPRIVAWIRRHESWRTGSLAPQTIAERAPAWKAGSPGNVPLAAPRRDYGPATPASTAPRRVYG